MYKWRSLIQSDIVAKGSCLNGQIAFADRKNKSIPKSWPDG